MDILDRCPGYIFVIFCMIRSCTGCTVSAYRMNAALVFGAFTHEKELFSVIPRAPGVSLVVFCSAGCREMTGILLAHRTDAVENRIGGFHSSKVDLIGRIFS